MKSLRMVALVILALTLPACGGDGLLEPPQEPGMSQALSNGGRGVSDGVPVVFLTTRTPSAAQANAPRVANLREAIHRVRANGTIIVEDGVWETDGVVINKPLTMKPAPGAQPVLTNNGTGTGLTIDGVAVGIVELQGLTFRNAAGLSAVRARGTYDQVLISNARVEVTAASAGGGTALGVHATPSSVTGAQLIVEKTTFVGGRICAQAQGTTAHVRNSHFTDCSLASVQYTPGALGTIENTDGPRGTIENNDIEGCGINACIRLFDPSGVAVAGNRVTHPLGTARSGIRVTGSVGGESSVTIDGNELVGAHSGIYVLRASGRIAGNSVRDCGELCIYADQPSGAMMIESNRVSARVAIGRVHDPDRPWLIAIMGSSQAPAGHITIRDNDVDGDFATDPADVATIGIQALSWNPFAADRGTPGVGGQAIRVLGNRVNGVRTGLQSSNGGVMDARDNVVNATMRGITSFGDLAVMRAQRNDILNSAVFAISGNGTIDARCNWWGSAGGPNNAAVPAAVYTPFAVVPIANRPEVACS